MAAAVIEAMECCGDRFDELDVATAIDFDGARASRLGTAIPWSVAVAIVLNTFMVINFGVTRE